MIIKLDSSIETYKTMLFRPGFNIVLADKHPEATEQDTRNGVGKSSLLEVMHFLLGASVGSESLFKEPEFAGASFEGIFQVNNFEWKIRRECTHHNTVSVMTPVDIASEDGSMKTLFNFEDSRSNPTITREYRAIDWKDQMSQLWFSLPIREKTKYSLSSRAILSYLIRRQSDGAFRRFQEAFSGSKTLISQAALMYLIGLDWTIATEWQALRDEEQSITTFEKAIKDKTLDGIINNIGEIRTQLVIENRRLAEMESNLSDFRILPEYRRLERESQQIQIELADLSEKDYFDTDRLRELRESLNSEVSTESINLNHFLDQANKLFKDDVKDRIGRVKTFHASVMANRQSYLRQEIGILEQAMRERRKRQEDLLSRSSQILSILQNTGALDQYNRLQKELNKQSSKVENLKWQKDRAEEFELKKLECSEKRNRLSHRLFSNYSEQSTEISEAIEQYELISSRLYTRSGKLIVEQTPNGPNIDIKISGKKSKGITNMQIFTFDFAMAILMYQRGIGPGFLVHDSHIFDGVDPRQIQSALSVAKQLTEETGLQYILCLTSDQIEEREKYDEYIVNPILYDHSDEGGLFGFRFG